MSTLYDEIRRVRERAKIITCYYCETCGTFGRSSSRKDHPVIGLMILRSQYKQIIESPLFKGLMRSTEHGTGWYVSKEDFDSILFEVLL